MCDRKQFILGLDRLDIQLQEDQLDNILLYCQELRKWNKRINLIARQTSVTDIVEKHFIDSLTLLPLIRQYGAAAADDTRISLLDVGSGAGFPGLVLAAVMPELDVTLAEPRQKRVAFLRHMVRTLRLTNVHIMAERIEAGQGREDEKAFTFITSRAVAAMDSFLPLIASVAACDTLVIMMRAGEERSAAQDRPSSEEPGEGWLCIEDRKFILPFSRHPRLLSVLRKKRL